MNKNFSWEQEEIKTLFKYVEVKKSEGIPLIKIFANYATCVGRGQNSVRNFYYATLKQISLNKVLYCNLGININAHSAKEVKNFTKSQADKLVKKVNDLANNGYSIRGACLKLANGDATKMIRIQNKYRSQTKQKKESNMSNVIKMPVKNTMSDDDINALFLGLIRLVKKQEQDKARQGVQIELETANEKLKKALKEIVIKSAEIEKLQSAILLLKEENVRNSQKQIKNRIKNFSGKKAKDIISDFVSRKKAEQEQTAVKN